MMLTAAGRRGRSEGDTAPAVQHQQRHHRAVGILQYIFALILHFNEFSRGAQRPEI